MATFQLEVRMTFSQRCDERVSDNTKRTLTLAKDGTDSILDVKKKIAVNQPIEKQSDRHLHRGIAMMDSRFNAYS